MTRYFWVLLHRYVGLAMAGFLIIVSLTGSLLAFFTELERIINPHWYPVHVQQRRLVFTGITVLMKGINNTELVFNDLIVLHIFAV